MSVSVSVIITARNAAATISDTVRSVTEQSYTQWELVVVDDGSTDATNEIVSRLAVDRRICHIRSAPIGRAAALNLACTAAQGKWLMILDADDLFHPFKIERQLAWIRSAGKYAILSCSAELIGERAAPTWRHADDIVNIRDVTRGLVFHNPVPHSGVCYSRELFDAAGGYDVQRRGALDYRFYVAAARTGGQLFLSDAVWVAKRIHRGQAFERRRRLRYLMAGFGAQCFAIKTLNGAPSLYAVAAGRLLYGLLPRAVRMGFRKH